MKHSLVIALLLFSFISVFAQSSDTYFVYSDDGNTMISGLTSEGMAAEELTIPSQVTLVQINALQDAQNLYTLIIEDGGNPDFEESAFGEDSSYGALNTMTRIILGNSMEADNMKNLFLCLGSGSNVSDVEITGLPAAAVSITLDEEDPLEAILTDQMNILMPAALVTDQVFGNANIFGKFEITNSYDLSTFCGNCTFEDTDDGSNLLFYVATELTSTPEIKIDRVHYIIPGMGVIMHRANSQLSNVAYLRRVDPDMLEGSQSVRYESDVDNIYGNTMLKGVLEDTQIGSTEGDKTNLILYNGLFWKTSGGRLGANRAYLQVNTEDLNSISANAGLALVMDDGQTESIRTETVLSSGASDSYGEGWFTLGGQRLENAPTQPGIYLHQGKKIKK